MLILGAPGTGAPALGPRWPQGLPKGVESNISGIHVGSLVATLGTLGLHKGGPWSQNGAQSGPTESHFGPSDAQKEVHKSKIGPKPIKGGGDEAGCEKIWPLEK